MKFNCMEDLQINSGGLETAKPFWLVEFIWL